MAAKPNGVITTAIRKLGFLKPRSKQSEIIGFLGKRKRATVTEIYTSLDMVQSECSMYLGRLRGMGMVVTESEEAKVYYSLNKVKRDELVNLAGQIAKI